MFAGTICILFACLRELRIGYKQKKINVKIFNVIKNVSKQT